MTHKRREWGERHRDVTSELGLQGLIRVWGLEVKEQDVLCRGIIASSDGLGGFV